MNTIINIAANNLAIGSSTHSPIAHEVLPRSASETDRVEFSDLGRLLAQIDNRSSFRAAKVNAVREMIREGTYETPDRINATVDRLLDIIA